MLIGRKSKYKTFKTTCRNLSNSKKRNTSLTLGEDKVLAVAVQKYPFYRIKAIDFIKKKNVAQKSCEVVDDELDFIEDGKSFFSYFQCFY